MKMQEELKDNAVMKYIQGNYSEQVSRFMLNDEWDLFTDSMDDEEESLLVKFIMSNQTEFFYTLGLVPLHVSKVEPTIVYYRAVVGSKGVTPRYDTIVYTKTDDNATPDEKYYYCHKCQCIITNSSTEDVTREVLMHVIIDNEGTFLDELYAFVQKKQETKVYGKEVVGDE